MRRESLLQAIQLGLNFLGDWFWGSVLPGEGKDTPTVGGHCHLLMVGGAHRTTCYGRHTLVEHLQEREGQSQRSPGFVETGSCIDKVSGITHTRTTTSFPLSSALVENTMYCLSGDENREQFVYQCKQGTPFTACKGILSHMITSPAYKEFIRGRLSNALKTPC